MKVYFMSYTADSRRRDTFKLNSKCRPLISSQTDCRVRSESEKRKYFDNICICLQNKNPQGVIQKVKK